MPIYNGNQIRVRIDGNTFNGETRHGVSFSNDLIEVTTTNTDGFPEYVSGVRSITVDFEKLMMFDETLNLGDVVVLHVGPPNQGFFTLEAIVESIAVTAASDEVVTYNGVFRVISPLREYTARSFAWCQTDGQVFCTPDGREIEFILPA